MTDDIRIEETQAANKPVLPPFDAPKYREAISDLDMTEKQVVEFLSSLDFILHTLVDLGFGVDSVQNFIPAMNEISSQLEADELEQKKNMDAFNSVAVPDEKDFSDE
jgi:hypothetical protein